MGIKLDLIDKKLLYELDRNSSIPVTKLAKKLRISKDRAKYRIENLTKKGIINKFITQVNPSRLGYFVYKIFLRFQNLTENKKQEILNWMIKDPNIYWVAESQGRWDLNATLFAEDINEFDKIFSKFTTKFGKFIAEQEINTTLKVGVLDKSWIYKKEKEERNLKYFWGAREKVKLDKIDVEILRILANNSRMNYVEIADKLKITPRIVIYRVKELIKKDLILGYSISINYDLVQRQFFKANIYFNFLDEETKKRIETYCKSRPNIIYFIFCVGNWPLEIEFNVKDNKEFYEEMNKFRNAFPEMKNYDTIFFTKEYKFDWVPGCYKPSK